MKKIISITIKTIIIIFLLKILIGLTSIPFDSNLDSNFSSQESWNYTKLFIQLLILGLIFGVISFSKNNNLISESSYILNLFSIGIFLSALGVTLISPLYSWYLTVCQLSQGLFLIFRQLSVLLSIDNPKLSYYLSLISSILSVISVVLWIIFLL